jgi:hypothetical protein
VQGNFLGRVQHAVGGWGTNLGCRGLPLDMTADEKTRRDGGSTRTDQIGKVFIVVGQDVRRCLVCEQLFTRRASAEHATVPCVLRFARGLR